MSLSPATVIGAGIVEWLKRLGDNQMCFTEPSISGQDFIEGFLRGLCFKV